MLWSFNIISSHFVETIIRLKDTIYFCNYHATSHFRNQPAGTMVATAITSKKWASYCCFGTKTSVAICKYCCKNEIVYRVLFQGK